MKWTKCEYKHHGIYFASPHEHHEVPHEQPSHLLLVHSKSPVFIMLTFRAGTFLCICHFSDTGLTTIFSTKSHISFFDWRLLEHFNNSMHIWRCCSYPTHMNSSVSVQ